MTVDDKIEVLKSYGYLTINNGFRHCGTYLQSSPTQLVPRIRGGDINKGLAIDILYGKLRAMISREVAHHEKQS